MKSLLLTAQAKYRFLGCMELGWMRNAMSKLLVEYRFNRQRIVSLARCLIKRSDGLQVVITVTAYRSISIYIDPYFTSHRKFNGILPRALCV